MGIETALQEAGEKGITVFEYFWETYPLYVVLILLGFAILLILACLPRKVTVVQHKYYPQTPIQQPPPQQQPLPPLPPLPPREIVVHQPIHEYGYKPKKKPRMTFENLDIIDNWGFLD